MAHTVCEAPPKGGVLFFLSFFPSLRTLGLLLATGMFPFASVQGTVVKPTDFGRLVDQAEFIFAGEVVAVRSEWVRGEGSPVIVTKVTFKTLEKHKGSPADRVELEFLGGTIGDTQLVVEGVPTFQVGQRAVLFVEKNGRSFCPLAGIYHGKLDLKPHPKKGPDCLWLPGGKPLTDTAQLGREHDDAKASPASVTATAGQEPMTLSDLKRKIAERLASQSAK